MTQLLLTTTGTPTSFRIPDLGTGFDHPVVDQDLMATWNFERLRESSNLQACVAAGECTLKDEDGRAVTDVKAFFTPEFKGQSWTDKAGRETELRVTDTNPYEVLKFTFTPPFATGDYKVMWYAEITTNNVNRAFRCCVGLDDATCIGEFVHTPAVKDEFMSVSGHADVTLDGQAHFVDFDINAVQTTAVRIRRVRLSIEKV